MFKKLISTLFILQVIASSATTIDQKPISLSVKPNIIFGLDDSGSMDSEVMQDTNDGAVWWNTTSGKRAFIGYDKDDAYSNTRKTLNFNKDGGADGTWKKYVYLFPNGTSTGNRQYSDSSNDHYAIAPIDAYANFRSSGFNPLYYNPSLNYTPWVESYSGGAKTFANANPTAAKSHPASGSSTIDLTKIQGLNTNADTTATAAGSNYTFRTQTGMPSFTTVKVIGNDKTSVGTTDATIPYLPATYWLKLATPTTACPTGFTCTGDNGVPEAIDGNRYQKIEIIQESLVTATTSPSNLALITKVTVVNGVTYNDRFPSGRSYVDEIQNFANWFQYYRKRKLMLASAMGQVLFPSIGGDLKGAIVGTVLFNARSSPTMYDLDNNTASLNGRAFLWKIYTNPANSGTPTRETLAYIGSQYNTNADIVKYSCQKNSAFILTDGYSNTASVTTTYDSGKSKTTWGATSPYTTTYDGSLADIAMQYYTNNLRGSTFVTGKVPKNEIDLNTNLHMNTYALTLGAKGLIYNKDVADPFTTTPTWVNPTTNRSPIMVDDLWHSTINGRGAMYVANDIEEVSAAIREALLNIIATNRSVSVVANPYVDNTNNYVYSPEYISYSSGDLKKYVINLTTPPTLSTTHSWSAKDNIDTAIVDEVNNIKTRKLVTFNGTAGVAITDTTLRTTKFGSIINASPIAIQKGTVTTIYQASNDGFLHVIEGATGNELWAYRPQGLSYQVNNGTACNNLGDYSSQGTCYQVATLNNQYVLDGNPSVNYVGTKTILVGGFGFNTVNRGFYALDITTSVTSSTPETDIASKVLWEFPGTNTTYKANLGTSTSQASIIKVAAFGNVVAISSGYNNGTGTGQSGGDGKGHVWLLNPLTGVVLAELKTPDGTTSAPIGMASLIGYALNPFVDKTAVALYGGDELGSIWKFNLTGTTFVTTPEGAPSSDATRTSKVASLGNTKPITVAVDVLADSTGKAIIYAVTGRFLSSSDITVTNTQSFVAILDSGTPVAFNELLSYANLYVNTTDSNLRRSKGIYYNFTGSGERGFAKPRILSGLVLARTINPSATSCEVTGYKDYIFDLKYLKPNPTPPVLPPDVLLDANGVPIPKEPDSLTNSGNVIIFLKGEILTFDEHGNRIKLGNYTIGRQLGSWREIFRK